eukprot:SAG11_NODE_34269_length_273_cov_0.431034_1_plen_77_part_10
MVLTAGLVGAMATLNPPLSRSPPPLRPPPLNRSQMSVDTVCLSSPKYLPGMATHRDLICYITCPRHRASVCASTSHK